jgi:hypothetical protein
MDDRKWVRQSLRQIAIALAKRRCRIGPTTVRRLLKKLKYRLFNNCQSLSARHPDREKQFRFIRRVKKLFLAAGLPVISVDTKKKELIGNFKNAGRVWAQKPTAVHTHDFPSDAVGRAVPYGIYDLTHQQGYVYVGTSYDTPEFAAFAIAQWWADPARPRFAQEDKLLILCDAGGSNSCRYWRWKIEVQQQLADAFGIDVMICHYPTGASKWNPIEHRLFSEISKNWAGKPLGIFGIINKPSIRKCLKRIPKYIKFSLDYFSEFALQTFQTMLNYIQDTTTTTGLKVKAFLVERDFEKGLKYDPQERDNLNLQRCRTCPTWNYILKPHACSG